MADASGKLDRSTKLALVALGLGLNTAIVASQSNLPDGISLAFRVDAVLAVVGLLVVLRYVHGAATLEEGAAMRKASRWHHRAHAG